MSVVKIILCVLFSLQLLAGKFYTIKRVVDADTFILNNDERIRLIGVDTPEKHDSDKLIKQAKRYSIAFKSIKKLGNIASNFASQTLTGKTVEIEFDKTNIKNNHRDTYNRLLVYLYFTPNETDKFKINQLCKKTLKSYDKIMFNKLLIKCGMAKVFRKFYFQYIYEFKKLEKDAKDNKTGFWADEYKQFFI